MKRLQKYILFIFLLTRN